MVWIAIIASIWLLLCGLCLLFFRNVKRDGERLDG